MRTSAIRKSMDGMSAATNSCFPATAKRDQKIKWLADKEFYEANVSGAKRILTPVHLATDMNRRAFYMDCVTGTLYRPKDGGCMSSDTLKILGLAKTDDAKSFLMKIKVHQVGEE